MDHFLLQLQPMVEEHEQSKIDFSMLPPKMKARGPLWSAFLALAITFSMLLIIGIVALLTNLSNRMNVMAVVGTVLFVVLIVVLVLSFKKLFEKFDTQKKVMRKFAGVNGWKFDDKRHTNLDNDTILPPSGMSAERTWTRFKVTGELNGRNFEYYSLAGFVGKKTGNWVMSGKGSSPAFFTILRIEGSASIINRYPDLEYEKTSVYTYITYFGNAISKNDVQHVFASLVN